MRFPLRCKKTQKKQQKLANNELKKKNEFTDNAHTLRLPYIGQCMHNGMRTNVKGKIALKTSDPLKTKRRRRDVLGVLARYMPFVMRPSEHVLANWTKNSKWKKKINSNDAALLTAFFYTNELILYIYIYIMCLFICPFNIHICLYLYLHICAFIYSYIYMFIFIYLFS